MTSVRLKKPIFFIGMPRSGTTVVFEEFAKSPNLGWLSNYSEMYPNIPSLNLLCPLLDNRFLRMRGNKKQYGKVVLGNRYLPQPVEAYNFWDMYTGRDFSRSYMLNVTAKLDETIKVNSELQKILNYQGKERFVTKLTGPGRVHYLASMFPDAVFIHLVRDGRSVVHSLMNVGFWREKGGFDKPFWEGGLEPAELELWHQHNNSPEVLCALQWRKIVGTIYEDCKTANNLKSLSVRYEDFVANPKLELAKISEITGCGSGFSLDNESAGLSFTNMNEKYKAVFSSSLIDTISGIMAPMLSEFGYQ